MPESGSRSGAADSRRGAAENLGLILAIIAFLAMGGFLYWLNVTAEPTEADIDIEAFQDDEDEFIGDVPPVQLTSLMEDAPAYELQEIQLRGVRVASFLGEQAIWIGEDQNPFLIRMAPQLFEQDGMELESGDRITVTGRVHTMSDSVLDAWEEQGVFPSPGDRVVAEFAEAFVEATEIREPREGERQQPPEDDDAEEEQE